MEVKPLTVRLSGFEAEYNGADWISVGPVSGVLNAATQEFDALGDYHPHWQGELFEFLEKRFKGIKAIHIPGQGGIQPGTVQ